MAEESKKSVAYTDDNIRHLSDMEHVRTRPGMYIGRLGDGKLPEDIKEVRRDSIMELQVGISEELNRKKIGRIFEVMVDEVQADGEYIGRTRYDAQEIDNEVSFVSKRVLKPGDIINVEITEAYEYDLVGEEV